MPENSPEQESTQVISDNENLSIAQNFIKLKNSQKIAVAFLAVFAVFVFWAWVNQFKNSIYTPSGQSSNMAETDNTDTVCATGDCSDVAGVEALKGKDTDEDGLSDYEELEVYNTSPYLPDSDSDGFTDKQEVESGNNPNCPTDTNCSQVGSSEDEESSDNFVNIDINQNVDIVNESDAFLEGMLLGESDAVALRAMLVQAGMDEAVLNQINDKDLMMYYEETLNSMNEAMDEQNN